MADDKDKTKEKEKDEAKGAAAEESAEGDPKAAKPAASKSKIRKLVLIGLPVFGAVLGAVATMAIPKPHPAETRPKEDKEKDKEKDLGTRIVFSIPDVKANLARSGGLHFCAAEFLVQVSTAKREAVEERLGLKGGGGEGADRKEAPPLKGLLATAVRDRIILLLNAKSIDDLEGRDKKEILKKEIRDELQPILFPDHDGEIEAVLFRELLIQ
jgi:flagellar basal body-associated protein FliL